MDTSIKNSSQSLAVDSFRIDGVSRKLTYEKFSSTNPTFKLIVSNSSAINKLLFYPTGSVNDKIIIYSGSTIVNKTNPVILETSNINNFGNTIELTATINKNLLDTLPLEESEDGNQLLEEIYFNVTNVVNVREQQTIIETISEVLQQTGAKTLQELEAKITPTTNPDLIRAINSVKLVFGDSVISDEFNTFKLTLLEFLKKNPTFFNTSEDIIKAYIYKPTNRVQNANISWPNPYFVGLQYYFGGYGFATNGLTNNKEYVELNTLSSDNRAVLYPKSVLINKRTNLEEYRKFLLDGYGQLFDKYFSGDSRRGKRRRGFLQILYYILENSKPNLRLKDVYDFETVNGRKVSGDEFSNIVSNWNIGSGVVENFEAGFDNLLSNNLVDFDDSNESIKSWTSGTIPQKIVKFYIDFLDDIINRRNNLVVTELIPPQIGNEFLGFQPDTISSVNVLAGTVDIDITNVQFSLSNAILSASKELIGTKTSKFFDEKREYKTLLNFGLDTQHVIEAWRPVNNDSSSIQLKLFNPLDDTIGIESTANIVREFAKPVIDTINIELPEEIDNTPYLRPPNMDVGKFNINKSSISNATINSLGLETGSSGIVTDTSISYDDRVFNRWYTSDFNSSELNIDCTDYNNFVTFGSAQFRLEAFRQKLLLIEKLTVSSSLSSSIESERLKAIEIEKIKRNFDFYEQFLYFDTEVQPYSASAYYVDGGVEYHATGSWPKNSSGNPISPPNVNDWYLAQVDIAKKYDEFNSNYLVKHLPEHIQEDVESQDFIRFVAMFGHIMDNLKVYIDQFPNIYSTNPDPFKELSMDQTYEIAKSFGIELPNAYSLESLQEFVESTYGAESSRTLVAETWKRFIHGYILFAKTKGSKSSLDFLLNVYGINTPAIQIKESSYPSDEDYLSSDEYAYTLKFVSASANRITIPFVSSSITGKTLQIRFNPSLVKTSTLLTGDDEWAVDLNTHPSASISYDKLMYVSGSELSIVQENASVKYGRISIISGSNKITIATSSYFPLFNTDDYTHIMLRSQSQDLTILQTDGDQILYQETIPLVWNTLWQNTKFVHIGGSGSMRTDTFDGNVDEVHLWAEDIDSDKFIKQAYDPGSYYGDTYTSSYGSLYVHLAFSQALPSITASVVNESPYVSASSIQTITTSGFLTSSYEKVLRSIKQYVPTVGATAYSNTKVRVAPPPQFNEQFIYDDGAYILSRTKSIKQVEEKQYTGGQNIVWFAVSPSEFVNQNIMRSMGLIDVNYLIGSPRKLKKERYIEVDELLEFYLQYYNKSINANQYIRFYKNLFKAPEEYVSRNTPARANLLNGIVIESPILERKFVRNIKAFRVDGANTTTFENFVSGSGSGNVGAYQFDANYNLFSQTDNTVITKPIIQYANDRVDDPTSLVTSSLVSRNSSFATIAGALDVDTATPVNSTPSASIPEHRKFLQNISTNKASSSLVVSSLTDKGSGIGYVTTIIDATPREQGTYTGYSRNPYLGLPNRIDSELNTVTPFYEINPVSNFTDVGTTTYFYNRTGIHWFKSKLIMTHNRVNTTEKRINTVQKVDITQKQLYRAKFDIARGEVTTAIAETYEDISLLDPNQLTDYPGRSGVVISNKTYQPSPAAPYTGILKLANLFSLYNIEATAGLRIRLYNTATAQLEDLSRPFATTPGPNVLFDAILDQTDNLVFPYTLIQAKDSTIYFTVDNTTASNISSEIQLRYFEYEPSLLVPSGYLPRHYKFTRHEPTAQKRRNYLGCKLVFCPEGCTDDILNTKIYLGRTKNTITTHIETESPVLIYNAPRTSTIVPRTGIGRNERINPVIGTGETGKLGDKLK